MSTKKIVFLIFFSSLLLLFYQENFADNENLATMSVYHIKAGIINITQDTLVEENILIETQGTLSIDAGVKLYFKENTGIICKGTITAIGTDDKRITFTAYESGWNNLTFLGSGSMFSKLMYCDIKNGNGIRVTSGVIKDYYKKFGIYISENKSKKQTAGGGIFMFDKANINLKHVTITNCTAFRTGGGIHIEKSSPTLSDCFVVDSNATNYGGGIYCEETSIIFQNCEMKNCKSRAGGGLYSLKSNNTYIDCSFENNVCELEGGAIYFGDPKLEKLISCYISENGAKKGAGIYCALGMLVAEGTHISYNKAGKFGAGMYCDGCEVILYNSNIVQNLAESGGGIYMTEYRNTSITECKPDDQGNLNSSEIVTRHETVVRTLEGKLESNDKCFKNNNPDNIVVAD